MSRCIDAQKHNDGTTATLRLWGQSAGRPLESHERKSCRGVFLPWRREVKKWTVKSVHAHATRFRSTVREGLEVRQQKVIVKVFNPRPFEIS